MRRRRGKLEPNAWCKPCANEDAAERRARKSAEVLANSRFRDDAHGNPEARCGHCSRWLPATRENFYMQTYQGRHVPHSWCKACYNDDRAMRREKKPVGNVAKTERPQRDPCAGDAEQIHFISRIPAGRLPVPLIGPAL